MAELQLETRFVDPPICEIGYKDVAQLETQNMCNVNTGGHQLTTTEQVAETRQNVEHGQQDCGLGAVVAAHYNTQKEKGLSERNRSRIVYLRNFNNWIKSMLISDTLDAVKNRKRHGAPLRVLDMGCGKGGDLFKWSKGSIKHLICADMAATSIEHCQARYNELMQRSDRDRRIFQPFTAEFITADCTKVRLREKYKDASIELDLVSCQFAFHYSFESLAQAECMLRNAAECLRPGGYFVGTIPDAYNIMARQKAAGSSSFGNEIYQISFDIDLDKQIPLFGAKYDFQLEGVVNCPEFLVYFPLLTQLAKKFGLKLVKNERFQEYYERKKSEGRDLLGRMQALETYPPFPEVELVGQSDLDYEHAKKFVQGKTSGTRIGTLSTPEWEAASLYLMFVFEKVKTVWNAEGKPEFVFNRHCSNDKQSKKNCGKEFTGVDEKSKETMPLEDECKSCNKVSSGHQEN